MCVYYTSVQLVCTSDLLLLMEVLYTIKRSSEFLETMLRLSDFIDLFNCLNYILVPPER